jgi:hypothetical protein
MYFDNLGSPISMKMTSGDQVPGLTPSDATSKKAVRGLVISSIGKDKAEDLLEIPGISANFMGLY